MKEDESVNWLTKEEIEKPYANEHACRLKEPGQYTSFARKNCAQKSDGKCIDVIYGIKAGKSEIQALRYPKDVWTASAARSHCKGRDGSFEAASKDYKHELEKHFDEIDNIDNLMDLHISFLELTISKQKALLTKTPDDSVVEESGIDAATSVTGEKSDVEESGQPAATSEMDKTEYIEIGD